MKRAFGQVAALLVTGVLFGTVLRMIYSSGMEQGMVLFVMLPLWLGFLAAMLPIRIHPVGRALLVTTVCLFESFLVFREGAICVLMAAPLFYGFAVFAAVVFDVLQHRRRHTRAFVFALPAVLLLFPRSVLPVRSATASVFVQDVSVAQIEERLAVPRIEVNTELPAALVLFPRPLELHGHGLEFGDERRLWMAGGEGQPGWFVATVIEREPGKAVFDIDDRSHIGHWLDWQRDTLRWRAAPGGVWVSWSVQYRSRLAPDWYFGPAEQLALQTALAHLLAVQTAPL